MMKYTTKKPTKPGNYFFRYWRHNSNEPYSYIIQVYEKNGELFVDGEPLREFGKLHPISPVKCEYSGPIQEPDNI